MQAAETSLSFFRKVSMQSYLQLQQYVTGIELLGNAGSELQAKESPEESTLLAFLTGN